MTVQRPVQRLPSATALGWHRPGGPAEAKSLQPGLSRHPCLGVRVPGRARADAAQGHRRVGRHSPRPVPAAAGQHDDVGNGRGRRHQYATLASSAALRLALCLALRLAFRSPRGRAINTWFRRRAHPAHLHVDHRRGGRGGAALYPRRAAPAKVYRRDTRG